MFETPNGYRTLVYSPTFLNQSQPTIYGSLSVQFFIYKNINHVYLCCILCFVCLFVCILFHLCSHFHSIYYYIAEAVMKKDVNKIHKNRHRYGILEEKVQFFIVTYLQSIFFAGLLGWGKVLCGGLFRRSFFSGVILFYGWR